jgi:hypothetical protein
MEGFSKNHGKMTGSSSKQLQIQGKWHQEVEKIFKQFFTNKTQHSTKYAWCAEQRMKDVWKCDRTFKSPPDMCSIV